MITILNTANIVFLKSTDDAMLDTLQKMSGTTHKVYRDGKQVTRDMEKLILQNEGKVSISLSVKEQPVIAYNDLAFMPMCNSIVFRAGDSPIWNRNQTCLPMSYRLFKNTIIQPGKEYSLQTVPSLSSASDFDVRQNMPNFTKMWEKRYKQSLEVEETIKAYKEAYRYTDDDIARKDPDKFADEIMMFVNQRVAAKLAEEEADKQAAAEKQGISPEDLRQDEASPEFAYGTNDELAEAVRRNEAVMEQWTSKVFCKGMISRDMLCPLASGRAPNHKWDDELVRVFLDERMQQAIKDGKTYDQFLIGNDGSFVTADGSVLIQRIQAGVQDVEVNAINEKKAEEFAARGITFTEEEKFRPVEHDGWKVTDNLYRYLVGLQSWYDLAEGVFEDVFADLLKGSDLLEDE